MEFLLGWDLSTLIQTVGYLGLFVIVFAESGLLIGFFLPGDSLLFTAGFLASQGFFDILLLTSLCFIAAVAGDSVGYMIGKHAGPRIFRRPHSWFFHPEHVTRTKLFYEHHGGKTIILARFMPVVRTFAPIFAGVGRMHYPTFLAYNIIGGVLWAIGMTMLGYALGSMIPGIDRYLIPIVFLIIVASAAPPLLHMRNGYRRRRQGAASSL